MHRRLLHYDVLHEIGRGGMGVVYQARDTHLDRLVAIKVLPPDAVAAPGRKQRFVQEARAASALNHPNIVTVHDYGDVSSQPFIVMEYVQGDELKRILNAGHRYELIEVFEIMKQLLGALDYSHKQGVVHRDVKPANLMIILPGPKLKVMDFGIARLESSSLTQVGTVVGTPTHMSPEQLMGLPADGRADLWSSGVILYELLTGVSPFLAETPAAVMHKVLQGEPAKPSELVPSLPPGFDALCARALAKKAEERFQTGEEFAGALRAALGASSTTTVDISL